MKRIYILIAVVAFSSCGRPDTKPMVTGKEGQAIPNFSLLLTDSTHYYRTAEKSDGRPKVLFYFSTTCPYCRAETRKIKQNIGDLEKADFIFVSDASLKDLKQFGKEFGIDNQKNIVIAKDTGYAVFRYFGFKGVPFIAAYNHENKLKGAYNGLIGKKQLIGLSKL